MAIVGLTAGSLTITQRDGGGEPTTSIFYSDEGNSDYATWQTKASALSAAVDDLVIGNIVGVQNTPIRQQNKFSGGDLAGPLAQREIKLLVSYRDSVTLKESRLEIGCVDLTQVEFIPNTPNDIKTTSPPAVAQFVTAFEDFCTLKYESNPVNVFRIQVVGRNT